MQKVKKGSTLHSIPFVQIESRRAKWFLVHLALIRTMEMPPTYTSGSEDKTNAIQLVFTL